ncbi:Ribosomal protein L11 methyltransferase [bacterium HR11]|nr:Ribosomal protein L11 methyltransferase [bacterium HR11]
MRHSASGRSVWEVVIEFHRPEMEEWFVERVAAFRNVGMYWTVRGPILSAHVFTDAPPEARSLWEELARLDPEVQVRQRILKYRDWQRQWQRRWRPIRVGRRWIVRPPWREARPEDRTRLPILIEPRRAFGTGLHETTQLMLRWMETLDLEGRTVADVGTGTGVLSIAAARAGAVKVYALDIDPEAVEEARSNVRLNGLTDRIECLVGSFEKLSDGSVDILLANLELEPLIEAVPAAARVLRPGGVWIVSGIFRDHHDVFQAALRSSPFRITGRRRRGEWMSYRLAFRDAG